MPLNKQIHLDNRPTSEALASNFKVLISETPPPRDGQVLVRHHFISLAPDMRGRLHDANSDAALQALGLEKGLGLFGANAHWRVLRRSPLRTKRHVKPHPRMGYKK